MGPKFGPLGLLEDSMDPRAHIQKKRSALGMYQRLFQLQDYKYAW